MSVRYWRRIRLFPGVTLNVSKTGVSLTLGFRGANWTIGRRGHTASVGLPGSGLSYRKQVSHENAAEGVRDLIDEEPKRDRDRRGPPPSAWSDFS